MATERTYTIPLRSGFRKTARYKKAAKAVKTLRAFLAKHMKTTEDDVKIGQHLNEYVWKDGIKNPPPRVKVSVKKDDEGIVTAELEGKEYKSVVKPQAATEEPQGLKEKLQAAVGGKKGEEPPEEKPKK